MVEIRNLSAGYHGKTVLSHLNLFLPKGRCTAVVGPNGCGKSTLLKAMAGILPADGTISFQNISLHALAPKERAKQIAFLPQNRSIPELTAEKLVLHGRFPYLSYPRHYRQADRTAALNAMEQMGIAGLADRYLPWLSGGERQKVYIAMLLCQQTPIVLMDEPTSFLDAACKFEVAIIGRRLAREGKTVVMVLHDLDLAMTYADHIAVMDSGDIAGQGTPEEIFQSRILERVFHIQVGRSESEGTFQYWFRPESEAVPTP